jgi:hypothetical protein
MSKNLTLAIAAVLIAGAGFGLGLVARPSLFAQTGPSDTKADAPRQNFDEALAAWKYPGAKLQQNASGDKLYYSVSTTDDDINTVGGHYAKVLGERVSVAGSGGGVVGNEEMAAVAGNDSMTADSKPRSVQAAFTTQRTKDCIVTVHVSRGKDDDATHIVLCVAQR